jgi:hypothetical protein
MPKEQFTYYPTPESPFREALRAVTGKEPPDYVRGFGFHHVAEERQDELHSWCAMNASPVWATGTSMIEAAELIVAGAIENANIGPDPAEAVVREVMES